MDPEQHGLVVRSQCEPFMLPANGTINMTTQMLTLAADALFTPQCATPSLISQPRSFDSTPTNTNGLRDAFYASVLPAVYALAASTVISYMLVIMLVITPRTFLSEGAVFLGRQGFTNHASSSVSGTGIGGRPWLQKVAALTVAISLTIATVETMRVAETQYNQGTSNAQALDTEVGNSTELKVIRAISDTFLWFAQAQTLIRLFPRQREKIIIKWTAFALILLDVIFNVLNSFYYKGTSRPRDFEDALPALSYLFELALGLLYCAWVMYYSLTKKRYAYYHPKMRNMCLVALLSLISVMVPVVFFILDISKPSMAIWGDYVRWVGAAAASVVVWEWVERIEALERNEKKDGVLGREVFDGDEMLEVTPMSELTAWTKRLTGSDGAPGSDGNGRGATGGTTWPTVAGIAQRYTRPRGPPQDFEADQPRRTKVKHTPEERQRLGATHQRWPAPPPASTTPVSRTETASAESTVYAVRYHPITEATPSIPELSRRPSEATGAANSSALPSSSSDLDKSDAKSHDPRSNIASQILARANPFHRKGKEPPPEISAAQSVNNLEQKVLQPSSGKMGFKARLENFAAAQADKFKETSTKNSQPSEPLPLISIPAPSRRRNNTELAAIMQEDNEDLESHPVTHIQRDNENEISRPPIQTWLSPVPGSAPVSPSNSRQTNRYSPDGSHSPPANPSHRGSNFYPFDSTLETSHMATEQRAESNPQSPQSTIFKPSSPISSRSNVTQLPGHSEGLSLTVIPAPSRRHPEG